MLFQTEGRAYAKACIWDYDGTFRNFQGFSLTGAGEGVLNEWQEMGLKKQAESHGESLVPSQGNWTLSRTFG